MSARPLARDWPDEVLRLLEAYQVHSLIDLAEAMRLKKSAVTNWTQRGRVPMEALKQAAKDTGRSLDWLSFGKPMFSALAQSELSDSTSKTTENLKVQIERADSVPGGVPPETGGAGSHAAGGLKYQVTIPSTGESAPPTYAAGRVRVDGPFGTMEYCFVPRYRPRGGGAIGPEAVNDDSGGQPGDFAFSSDWMKRTLGRIGQGFYLVDIVGSNMEPTFYEGDTVLVDRMRRDLHTGGLFALRRGASVLVRRVQGLQLGGFRLLCDNPSFPPEVVPPEAASVLEVVGKVVWPRHR